METVTHWGVLACVDSVRHPLPWPTNMLIVGPVGLGDTVVTLPALRRIQKLSPATGLTWFGPSAYRPLVAMMGVGEFLPSGDPSGPRLEDFDAVLSFADVGAELLGNAESVQKIPVRVGSWTARSRPRWVNHLVHTKVFGRPRHEAQRNLRLLLPFGAGEKATQEELVRSTRVVPPNAELPADLPAAGFVVLHPFSQGHGREWPLRHWVALATALTSAGISVVVTGTGAERERLARAWPSWQRPHGVFDASGRLDVAQLCTLLHRARSMVASSTGPLHVAAALGTPALGLYPTRRGLALDRWAPLGTAAVGVQAHRRCPRMRKCRNDACDCMSALAPERIAPSLVLQSSGALNLDALAPYFVAAPRSDVETRAQPTRASSGDVT